MSDKCAECGYSEHFHNQPKMHLPCSGFRAAERRRYPWELWVWDEEGVMALHKALKIVLDLAQGNAFDDDFLIGDYAEGSPMWQLQEETKRQRLAIGSVEDFLEHNFVEREGEK